MTERDWFDLSSPEDLEEELAAVVQPRKLFQLGAAFLTRVWDLLPGAVRDAVAITRDYIDGKAGARDILEAWTNAEQATADSLWVHGRGVTFPGYYDCDPPDDHLTDGIHAGVREGICDPAWFAAHAAARAIDLAVNAVPFKKRDRRAEVVRRQQLALLCDLIGDPFAPARPAPVRLDQHPQLARLIHAVGGQEDLDSLGVLALADALEEGGCLDGDLLAHLRSGELHVRGCWAVERIAGREMIELPVDDQVIWPLEKYERRGWW